MNTKITLSIGHKPSNDIVLEHETISSTHAYLMMLPNNTFELSDAGSTNGIFVNNRKIKRKIVDEKDQVIIGGLVADMHSILAKAREKHFAEKIDFSEEYKTIVDTLTIYSKQKDKLSGNSTRGNLIRVGLSLVFICILLFTPDLIKDPTTKYILIMLLGLIPVFTGLFADSGEKKRTKQDLLKLQYEDEIRCPKCKGSLIRYTPSYLIHKGKCPNEKCNAKFVIKRE